MAKYIVMLKYTNKGIADIKGSPTRLENAKKAIASMGGRISAFYLTLGRYDAVTVMEAPDDETVAKFALATGSQGNVQTETLRAFDEDEFKKIIASLP